MKTLQVEDEIHTIVKEKQVELLKKYKKNIEMFEITAVAIKIGISNVENELLNNNGLLKTELSKGETENSKSLTENLKDE